jgi:hypothetical protein
MTNYKLNKSCRLILPFFIFILRHQVKSSQILPGIKHIKRERERERERDMYHFHIFCVYFECGVGIKS